MLSWINTTKNYIRKNPGFLDFDICMAHFVLPGGEVARWLKKKYGLPYVLISHGHEIPWVHPRQMFFFHLGAYCWIKKVCKDSAINFIQTRMMKSNIDRFLGRKYRENNVIIPNGVDTARFYPDYSKRPQQLRIIFIGRLVIQKDPMTFLKAIKLFYKYTADFDVHILGNGNLRRKMERFVNKNGLSENVKFLGKIPEENIVEEYQAAHLMVAPSLNEGMSISALEALSCGVYLIATRASGFEEMIRENVNGEFINFKDTEGLSKKLIDFYRGIRKEQIVSGTYLNKIRRAFNWKSISMRYLELYKSQNK
jgi:glycosyltransferase involved in cell wall biosynthesis